MKKFLKTNLSLLLLLLLTLSMPFAVSADDEYGYIEEAPQPTVIVSYEPLSAPIRASEHKSIEITVSNLSNRNIKDVTVSFKSSGSLMVTDGVSAHYIGDINRNTEKKVTLEVTAMDEISSQSQSVEAEVTYTYHNNLSNVQGKTAASILIPAATGEKKEEPKPDGAIPVPKLIISGYNYGGKEIQAGEAATLRFSFKNTSKVAAVENVVATVSGGAELMLNGSTNTFYYDSIEAGGQRSISVPLKAAQQVSAPSQDVVVSFQYEYVDGDRASTTTELRISVPLSQPDRFTINPPVAAYEGSVGEEVTITLDYVNRGKAAVNNLEATVTGDVDTMTPFVRIGTVEAGKSGAISFSAAPQNEGENQLNVTVTYEDANGESREKTFTTVLTAMPFVDEPFIDEPMEPIEEQQASFPWWIVILLALAGGIVFLVLRKKKKKKAKLAAEQALWDAWDEEEKSGTADKAGADKL